MEDGFSHVKHVFMTRDEAEVFADYEEEQSARKCKVIAVYDHPGAFAVLRYDEQNHPSEVILLSDYPVGEEQSR